MKSPKARLSLYLILAAGLVTLAGRGLISQEEAKLWTDVASQILAAGGLLLAAGNVDLNAGGKHRKRDE